MEDRIGYWEKMVAAHEASGQCVREFCQERQVSEHSFYVWRKRLRERDQPVRFAVVDAPAGLQSSVEAPLELVLVSGERLRIGAHADVGLLRAVLGVLRG